jgi:hypothetical protein
MKLRILFLLLLDAVLSLRLKPMDPPRNFGGASASPANGEQEEKGTGFPVFHVRFNYPPSFFDARRVLALGTRQAEILSGSSRLSRTIGKDSVMLFQHIDRQKQITKYLLNLPSDLFNPIQKKILRIAADTIPVVSLIQKGVVKNPQVNIAVEDNSADFSIGSDISPSQGVAFLSQMNRSWMTTRKLCIALLRVNMRRLELLGNFLISRITKTSKFITAQVKENEKARKEAKKNAPKTAKTTQGSFMQLDDDMVMDKTLLDDDDDFLPDVVQPEDKSNRTVTAFVNAAESMDFPLVMALRSRVMSGGRTGTKALAGLVNLWNEHKGAREMIKKSMVMMDCLMLLKKKDTSDYTKNLAGTLMSLITGLPVWSNVVEFSTGSDAHVNIVVPRPSVVYRADKVIALATGGD